MARFLKELVFLKVVINLCSCLLSTIVKTWLATISISGLYIFRLKIFSCRYLEKTEFTLCFWILSWYEEIQFQWHIMYTRNSIPFAKTKKNVIWRLILFESTWKHIIHDERAKIFQCTIYIYIYFIDVM